MNLAILKLFDEDQKEVASRVNPESCIENQHQVGVLLSPFKKGALRRCFVALDEKGPPDRNELVEKGHHGLSTLSFFRSHFSRRRPIAHFETTVLTEEEPTFPRPKDLVRRAGLPGRAPLDRRRRGRIAGA